MGLAEESFCFGRIDIPSENIILIGVDTQKISNEQYDLIRKYKIPMYCLKTIKKRGIVQIMNEIIDILKYDDVHVVIDLSCMQKRYAPSVIRDDSCDHSNDDGLDFDQMRIIVESIVKLNYLNGVDVTGYNFGHRKDKQKHHISNMLTVKTIEMIVNTLIDLKQKSINLFNDESKFLIWRKVNDYDTVGWYILRNISLKDREELIKAIANEQFVIISIPADDNNSNDDNNEIDNSFDALVAVTSMKEQQEKSYYNAESLYDFCLYPGEKLNMMFELLNTPSLQTAQIKTNKSNKTNKTNKLNKTLNIEKNLIQIQVPQI
jgi:hypothetical protein